MLHFQGKEQRHAIDFLFTVTLFCVFTVCALLVLMIGVSAYRSTTDRMERNFTSQTSLSYIANKVRHFDTAGSVSLQNIEGADALALTRTAGEERYVTYIYCYNGQLMEMMVREGTSFPPENGEAIADITSLAFKQNSAGSYVVTVTQLTGEIDTITLTPRSDTGKS